MKRNIFGSISFSSDTEAKKARKKLRSKGIRTGPVAKQGFSVRKDTKKAEENIKKELKGFKTRFGQGF